MLPECRSDWEFFGRSCYYLGANTEGLTWHQAAEKCLAMNSHLVHIKSRQVTAFMHLLTREAGLYGNGNEIYIGKHLLA